MCLHVPSNAPRFLQSVCFFNFVCGLGPAVEVKPDQGPSDFCKQKARFSRNVLGQARLGNFGTFWHGPWMSLAEVQHDKA